MWLHLPPQLLGNWTEDDFDLAAKFFREDYTFIKDYSPVDLGESVNGNKSGYFRNPLPLKNFTDFKEAEAEVLYHLGEILPLDIQPPNSVQVDIAIFAGQLVRAQRK